MPGERFFELRDRLLGCFGRIEELAEASGIEVKEDPDDPRARLERNLQVLVLGEINAGKSTLLNALVGAEMCPSGPLPITNEFRHYRFGPAAEETRRGKGWIECPRQHPLLETFELIDSPGTNSPMCDEVLRLLPELEEVDLILIVFPAENTWTAATWDVVSALSDAALEHTALVVQQSDKKQAADLKVIRGHMTDLCLKKVGRELPILCVSAKLALEAKQSPTGSREGWAASGFAAFEEFLNERVCLSPEREHFLMRACQQAGRVMRDVEEGLDKQRRGMDDDGWFLTSLEREVEQLRGLVEEMSPDTRSTASERYRGEVEKLGRSMDRRLGHWPTLTRLFLGDSAASAVEVEFSDQVQQAIEGFAVEEMSRLMEECEGHWGEVRPRVRDRMGMDPGDLPLSGEVRAAAKKKFVGKMLRAVTGISSQLRVRARLDPLLRRRNRILKGLVGLGLFLLTLAGVLGIFGQDGIALGFLAVTAGIIGLGLLYAWFSRRRVVKELSSGLLDATGRYESALGADYSEAVRFLFREYSNGLIGIKRQLAERRSSLAPRSERWDALYLELKLIEQDLA